MSFSSAVVKTVHFLNLDRNGNQLVEISFNVDLGIPNSFATAHFGISCSTVFTAFSRFLGPKLQYFLGDILSVLLTKQNDEY